MLLDFFGMSSTYKERKVVHYEQGDVFVDTCRVTDSDQPFETAVGHPKYNKGQLVIVEMYDTIEAAKLGYKQ